jgi:hypothetical protein
MNDRRPRLLLPLVVAACAIANPAFAQTTPSELTATILQRDGLFWKAYNACDVEAMAAFFPEDVEFYHDRGGPTLGLTSLVGTTRQSLCGRPDSRLRREAVEGTVRVFPLQKENAVYGAILSGEHVFYILDKGQPARLDGRARFTHLWLQRDGAWKMARVLSYDHGPAVRAESPEPAQR